MAYSIKLYQTPSDKRTVNKTLSSVMDSTAEIWGDCDLLSPSLLLNVPPGVNFNYLQVLDAPFNGRYYYVDTITLMQNGIRRVTCSIDVLMSYKSDIKKETAVIERQEFESNAYMPDSEAKLLAYEDVVTKKFSSGFAPQNSIILVVAGGN